MVTVPAPGAESLVDWLLDEKLVKVCSSWQHSTQAAAKDGSVQPCIVRVNQDATGMYPGCTAFTRNHKCYRVTKASYDALDFPWWAFGAFQHLRVL